MGMTEKMKALGNDFIEKCESQGLTFDEMQDLLLNMEAHTNEAIDKLRERELRDDVARIRRF